RRPTRPPNTPLFPYTTLFRSELCDSMERSNGACRGCGYPSCLHKARNFPAYGLRDLFDLRAVSHVSGSDLLGPPQRLVFCRRARSEEHTSELQSPCNLVCRLL